MALLNLPRSVEAACKFFFPAGNGRQVQSENCIWYAGIFVQHTNSKVQIAGCTFQSVTCMSQKKPANCTFKVRKNAPLLPFTPQLLHSKKGKQSFRICLPEQRDTQRSTRTNARPHETQNHYKLFTHMYGRLIPDWLWQERFLSVSVSVRVESVLVSDCFEMRPSLLVCVRAVDLRCVIAR